MKIVERLNEWGKRDTERGKQLYKDIQDAIQQLKKIQSERDELLAALKDARAIFAFAYECAEKGFNDECLLHLGIGGARADKAISKCES